ncbi:hypothetical protein [Oscillibacter sp.]|uniref:hypothetical protein n=1 Tax=Oscillibacter sp. TaxID=1945593 RepID=UPI0028965763|nr:hypothetical protein [Oscillibacter sp.]
MDLSASAILLAPGNAYYPGTYLSPGNADTAVPESTGRFEKIRADYLSQRFVLKVPDDGTVNALTFKLSGRHTMGALLYAEVLLLGIYLLLSRTKATLRWPALLWRCGDT